MKIAKMMCPVCHKPVTVTHTYKYETCRVRKYRCDDCKLVIRTVQKTNEKEAVKDYWQVRPYTRIKEEFV